MNYLLPIFAAIIADNVSSINFSALAGQVDLPEHDAVDRAAK